MGILYTKATLHFPTCDLLWSYLNRTQGIHLNIQLKRNTLKGLFLQQDLQMAVREFKANYTEEGHFFIEHTIQRNDPTMS